MALPPPGNRALAAQCGRIPPCVILTGAETTDRKCPERFSSPAASSGIGKATAQLFAESGWNVAATMRSPQKGGEWARGDRTMCLPLDVTKPESIRKAIDDTLARFGSLNAGYGLVIARAMPNLQKAGAMAPGPEVVARVIYKYKAVTDGSWKLRYAANGALFLALRRLFPESWFRAIVNRAIVR
jgi:NAD(P)-dependent dehydrogenase (short-subunit alcohol dehydrogenase family)